MADSEAAEILRELERYREILSGPFEAEVERRLTKQLEAEFDIDLGKELRQRSDVIVTLRERVKSLEAAEEARRSQFHQVSGPDVASSVPLSGGDVDAVAKVATKVREFSFLQYVRIICLIQLLLSFGTSLVRADLFCVAVLVALYACHEHDKRAMALYLGLIGLSSLVDFIWLAQHSSLVPFGVTRSYQGAISFAWALSLVALLFKLIISYPAYQHFRDLPAVKPSEQGRAQEFPLRTVFAKIVFALFSLQLVVTFFISLGRSDLYAVVLLMFLYAVHEKDKKAMLLFFGFLGVSVVLDIAWIATHAKAEFSEPFLKAAASAVPRVFVLVLTIINLVLKIVFLYPCYKLFTGLPHSERKDIEMPQVQTSSAGDSTFLGRVKTTAAKVPSQTFLQTMVLVQMALVFLESGARFDPYAVVIVILLYAILEVDKLAVELYIGLMAVSIIFDIAWLGIHSNAGAFQFLAGTTGIMKLTIALVVLSLIAKIVSLVPTLSFHSVLPEIKPSESDTAIGKSRLAVLSYRGKFAELDAINKYSQVLFGAAVVFMILFFLESLVRPDPFCLAILLLFYAVHEQDRTALNLFLVVMDFTIVLDIVWLSLHSEDLAVLADPARRDEWASVNELLQFAYAIVIFLVFLKILIHIPTVLLIRVLPATKPSDEGSALEKWLSEKPKFVTPTAVATPAPSHGESSWAATAAISAPLSGAARGIPLEAESYPMSLPAPAQAEASRSFSGEQLPNVPPYIPAFEDKIDQYMADFVDQHYETIPVKISRQGPGIYLFGTRRVICKILNDKLVARVGGGYMTIDEFVETYGAIEAEKVLTGQY